MKLKTFPYLQTQQHITLFFSKLFPTLSHIGKACTEEELKLVQHSQQENMSKLMIDLLCLLYLLTSEFILVMSICNQLLLGA